MTTRHTGPHMFWYDRIGVVVLLLLLVSFGAPDFGFAQASLQRGVRISNANGNYITILSGTSPLTYTILLPQTSNPSTTSASLLYGIGLGQLNWTSTAGVASGNVLSLQTIGPSLVPTWVDPVTVLGNSFWSITGNSITTAYNGTTGNFLGTTNAQPLVIATTNTVSAQPIKFFTNNTESMRLSPAGELGIGLTPNAGKLLDVAGTAGTADVRLRSLGGATLATALAGTDGLVIADANGDLTKRSYTTLVTPLSGSFVNYDVTGSQILSGTRTHNLFNVGYNAGANDANAAGAIITSTAGASNRSATGLSINSTASGSGTSTGLSVTAVGGANQYAALFTGNVGIGTTTPTQLLEIKNGNLLLSNGLGTPDQLQFQGTSTGVTSFVAGAQGSTNITYTLPTSLPLSTGYVLSSTTTGALSWLAVGSSVTGTGIATRVAFWGPGPGPTSNLQDDINLYWDNVNKRLSLGSGTAPNTSLDITKDMSTREYNYTTATTATMNNVNFDGANNQTAFVRISNSAAPFSITGISGGSNGKHLQVYNASAQTMTLSNQSVTSTSTNRLITGTGVSLVVPSGGTANFIYSGTDNRWISYAASVGSSAWLTTGNLGLVDNVTNLLGTIDNTNVRFVTGSGGPNTRMMIDFNGNELLGPGATTSVFASGSGRFAYGDQMNTTRLNSVPSFQNRVFNMIDQNAVLRVWRFNSNAGGTDPAIEFVGGTNDNQGNSADTWWDVYTTGTPGVAGSGTRGQGEHMAYRRRTGSSDSEYFCIFAGGNIGLGQDGTGTVPTPDIRVNGMVADDATTTVSPILALNHRNRSGTATGSGFGSSMLFRGNTTTTTDQQIASISGLWTTATNSSRTGALTFATVNGGSALSEAMRIAGNGNVGINQTNPSQLLEVRDGNVFISSSNTTAGQLQLQGTSSGISTIAAGAQGSKTINYTLPTSQPSTGQVLSATSVSGGGPYNVGLGWASSSGSGVEYAIKANDQNQRNQATPQNDNDLSLAIGSNETWEVNGQLMVTSPTSNTPDIIIGISVPSGASARIWITSRQENTTTVDEAYTINASSTATFNVITTNPTDISFRGWVQNGSTSGNVTLQWAQGTSNTNRVYVKADSYMKMTKLN